MAMISPVDPRSRDLCRRIGVAGLGIVFSALALTIWNQSGYLGIGNVIVESYLLFVAAFYSMLSVIPPPRWRGGSLLVMLPAFVSTAIVLFWLWKGMPAFGTDELAIDYFSAYAFLHEVNHYLSQSVSGAF